MSDVNIVVYGMGYVGQVTGSCLAFEGNSVTLVGLHASKAGIINSGRPTIVEDGLSEIVSSCVSRGVLRGCISSDVSLRGVDVVFVAVGTPYSDDGSIDLSQVSQVAESVGKLLSDRKLVIVVKSTVVPGTTDWFAGLVEKFSGKKRGKDFFMAMNPEFLREGLAVKDCLSPDSVVFGGDEYAVSVLRKLYSWTPNVHVVSSVRAAESVKYFKNSLLALKIHLANTIANYCEKEGIDYVDVKPVLESLDVPFFFRNGPGFGGSCFPKDVSAINKLVKSSLLTDVLSFNKKQALHVLDYALSAGVDVSGKRVSVYGLAFKPDTDDVRESPGIRLINSIKCKSITVFDPEPQAVKNAVRDITVPVKYAVCLDDAVKSGDVHFVMTDWPVFKDLLNISAPVFFAHRFVEPDIKRGKYCLGSPLRASKDPLVLECVKSFARDLLIKSKRVFASELGSYFSSVGVSLSEVVTVATRDHRLSSSFLI